MQEAEQPKPIADICETNASMSGVVATGAWNTPIRLWEKVTTSGGVGGVATARDSGDGLVVGSGAGRIILRLGRSGTSLFPGGSGPSAEEVGT